MTGYMKCYGHCESLLVFIQKLTTEGKVPFLCPQRPDAKIVRKIKQKLIIPK